MDEVIEKYKKEAQERFDVIFKKMPNVIPKEQCKELCMETLIGALEGTFRIINENLTKHNKS